MNSRFGFGDDQPPPTALDDDDDEVEATVSRNGDGVEMDELDTSLSLRPPGTTTPPPPPPPEKPEEAETAAANNNNNIPPPVVINSGATAKNQSRKRAWDEWGSVPAAVQRAVESRGGRGGPFKVGWKKLEEGDLGTRLVVTREENLRIFLKEEEAAAVDGGGDGLAVAGVDTEERVYSNLRIARWRDAGVVIEREWNKVISDNKAKVGNVVEIWGFRVRGNWRPCLAFNFREETTHDDS